MQTALNIVSLVVGGAGLIGGILTVIGIVAWVVQQAADYIHDHRLL